jgi:3,4-dihydroxy 2-butanone 4-phosphate synthase/GTP cyclohydrolase II
MLPGTEPMASISPTQEIIEEIRAGRMVILVDEADRENEGDLVMAAEFITPEAINFMARFGRGLICLTLTEDRCRQLNLPLMVAANKTPYGTNFTVSIEAAQGVTTGISAADRATTVRAAVKPDATPEDLIQPGHIFPLMAQNGGVLVRAGHTEAGCDIAQLAGCLPAAVICEILKDDGEMARLPDLVAFAKEHGLKIGTIADLINYRSKTEKLVERRAQRLIQTAHGEFELIAYYDRAADETHLALVKGKIDPQAEILVRVHEPLSEVDLLEAGSERHSWSVQEAMRAIDAAGCGVIVLLRRAGTAADLIDQVAAGEKAGQPVLNLRQFGIGSQILKDLQVRRMRLLAQPRNMPNMAGFGLTVTGFIPAPERTDADSAYSGEILLAMRA